jgi:hypothetical protein
MRGSAVDFDAKWSSLRSGVVLCLLCLAAVSCGTKSRSMESAAPTRATGPAWRTPAQAPPAQAPNLAASPSEPSDPLFANGQPSEQPRAAAPAEQPPAAAPAEDPAEQPAQAEAEAKPARDFSAELVQMLGNPIACLSARAAGDAPRELEIALATQVMPSGAVGRSEVSAPGLEAGELACLRGRVEALHFTGPIENAPFAVRGSVHLTRAATPAPTAPSGDDHANGDGTKGDPSAAPSPTGTPL